MTTNLQMGICYALGKANAKGGPVCLDNVLGSEYEKYDISFDNTLNGKEYVLYRDLGANGQRIGAIDGSFSITQIEHIFEEIIQYDKKKT